MNTKQITHIPHDLLPAFVEWLDRGGHEVKQKKNGLFLVKNDKRGHIFGKAGVVQESYLMNDYMIERFALFSQQWLKYGKKFVKELDVSMKRKLAEMHRLNGLAKVT